MLADWGADEVAGLGGAEGAAAGAGAGGGSPGRAGCSGGRGWRWGSQTAWSSRGGGGRRTASPQQGM